MKSFIKSSNEKTAEQLILLSPLDQIALRVYIRLILCFPTQSSAAEEQNSIFSALEKGLQQSSTEIPFLGGLINNDKDTSGRFHIAPGRGILLRSKDLTDDTNLSYQKLKDAHFPLSALDGDVLAPVGMLPSESSPVMAAQINFVRGGMLLVLGIHHSAMDAAGFGTVLKTLAKNTRSSFIDHGTSGSDPTELTSLNPNALDRGPLMQSPTGNSVDSKRKIKNHPQYKIQSTPPLPAPLSETDDAPPPAPFTLPPMTATIFHFSARKLSALKRTASPSSSYISTNDALCALLWRSITRARHLPATGTDSSRSSMLGLAVDGRSRLEPPLPQSYLGNVIVSASARLPLSALADPSALSATASAVRAAVSQLGDDRVRDVIALVASLPVVTDLQPSFNSFLGPDLLITCWRDMDVVGLDWGPRIGAVESVRIPRSAFDGLCVVLPALAHGGLEVLVGLESGAMERLSGDESFMEWAELRCV